MGSSRTLEASMAAHAEHLQDSSPLPVSPALDLVMDSAQVPRQKALVDARVLIICMLAAGIGVVMAVAAQLLIRLIFFFTHLSFYGRLSISPVTPFDHHLGAGVI